METLPDFSYKTFTTHSLDLADFFKDFEMNKFLEECNYANQALYVECTKMGNNQPRRKLKLGKYINNYLESPSLISPV